VVSDTAWTGFSGLRFKALGGFDDESKNSLGRLVHAVDRAGVSAAYRGGESYIAYISDSTNSSVIYWIAKEAGLVQKTRPRSRHNFHQRQRPRHQSLIAGDLGYSGAVGPAVINAKLAGADIAIIRAR
jgi:hypothetical protein